MGNACGPKKGIAEDIMLELEVRPLCGVARLYDFHLPAGYNGDSPFVCVSWRAHRRFGTGSEALVVHLVYSSAGGRMPMTIRTETAV